MLLLVHYRSSAANKIPTSQNKKKNRISSIISKASFFSSRRFRVVEREDRHVNIYRKHIYRCPKVV